MVLSSRIGHLLAGADLRAQRDEPSLAGLCVRVQRARLRVPVRRVPVYRRRVLRHPRPEPELGLHDSVPRHLEQHFQFILWFCLRRPFHH